MIEGTVFIGAVIVAVTEAIKDLSPKVQGWITVAVAALVGLLIALIDTNIGVEDLSIAQGVLIGLSAAGVVGTVKKVGK